VRDLLFATSKFQHLICCFNRVYKVDQIIAFCFYLHHINFTAPPNYFGNGAICIKNYCRRQHIKNEFMLVCCRLPAVLESDAVAPPPYGPEIKDVADG